MHYLFFIGYSRWTNWNIIVHLKTDSSRQTDNCRWWLTNTDQFILIIRYIFIIFVSFGTFSDGGKWRSLVLLQPCLLQSYYLPCQPVTKSHRLSSVHLTSHLCKWETVIAYKLSFMVCLGALWSLSWPVAQPGNFHSSHCFVSCYITKDEASPTATFSHTAFTSCTCNLSRHQIFTVPSSCTYLLMPLYTVAYEPSPSCSSFSYADTFPNGVPTSNCQITPTVISMRKAGVMTQVMYLLKQLFFRSHKSRLIYGNSDIISDWCFHFITERNYS